MAQYLYLCVKIPFYMYEVCFCIHVHCKNRKRSVIASQHLYFDLYLLYKEIMNFPSMRL